MMNNYNSLSLGISSYLKKWSSSSVGSPSTTNSIKSTSVKWFALVLFLLMGITNYAQTTIINGTTDGSFESNFGADGWITNFGATPTNNILAIGNAATIGFTPTNGSQGVFVTNNGTTRGYDHTSAITWIYKDVTLPAGQTIASLTMDMFGNTGDTGYDGIIVGITDQSYVASLTTGATGAMTATAVTGMTIATTTTTNGFIEDGNYATASSRTFSFPGAALGNSVSSSARRIWIGFRCDASVGNLTTPYSFDKVNMVTVVPTTLTAVQGGLWNSPATWGGTVPAAGNNVVIPAGLIVTVNQAISYNNLTINGILQWGGTSFAMNLSGDLTVNSGGNLLAYTTALTGQSITIGGNFTNNGYANLAMPSAALTFNGSGSTLSGTGTFLGNGVKGIIRALLFTNLGSNTISTTQDLITTSAAAVTAGSLNTNGKLTIDNTAQVYGQALNLQVANLVVTTMNTTAYSVAPVVFGAAVTQWNAITGTANTLYVSGNNVYRSLAAASIGASAPTHTSGITSNLLWIGTRGTLGTPFQFNTSVAVGTQVFYGNRLYTCIIAGIPSSAAPPTHVSGTAASGAATFLYVGSPATATVNFDSVTGTVRSLNLTSPGSGYSGAPAIAFSVGVLAGTGAGAAATAVYIQQVAGTATFLMQKSGVATISGGLTINSDQGASLATANPQASTGVGAISTTNGGVNYLSVPTVGFAGPPALNLITNPGSGYLVAPTVTVTGGTLISGTALTTSNFTITVQSGKVGSVYLNTATSATYSTPPTLTLTASPGVTATLEFPAGCWPTATATVGSNRQITNFTVTNAGYGYAAAPSVGLSGGTPASTATGPTCRLGSYSLTLNFFSPAASAVVSPDDAVIPTNRKLNNLSLAGNGNGLNLSGNLTLYGTAPLTLAASLSVPGNVLDLGGNNLDFTWNGYAGTTSTFGATTNTYIKKGSMTLTGRGGPGTFNFPFSGTFTVFQGSTPTAVTTGSNVTRLTVTQTDAPSNATPGTGLAIGNRSFRLQYDPASNMGLNPTVTMNFNSDDALTVTQDVLYIAESADLTGAWNNKSTAFGVSGALPATGQKATATVSPGPIAPNGDTYYSWSSIEAPTVTSVSPTTFCAATGAFTITGTGLASVSGVTIGGTPVTSFVIQSPTQITGIAGAGTDGTLTVVSGAGNANGPDLITLLPIPTAPTVDFTAQTVEYGVAPLITASGAGPIFNWYTVASGGTLIFTGATFNSLVCATSPLYVAQSNGTCEGPRTLVSITVTPRVIAATTTQFCGVGGASTLSVTPVPGATYQWTALTAGAAFTSGTTDPSADVTVTQTSDFRLVITGPGSCTSTLFYSIGVYALPTATVTTSASGVCPLTAATINSGLVAGTFSSASTTFASLTPPVNAVTLATGGVATPALTSGTLDDGGWGAIPLGFNFSFFGTTYNTINVGTNGTLQFGTYNATGLGDFTFTTLPSTAEPFNMVAVLAMDNDLRTAATGGAIRYWTQGYAPNRRFVVMYDNVQEYGDVTKFSTAQAIFYETTGLIDVHVTSSSNVDRVKLVGINNGTGTIGSLAYNSGTVASVSPQNPITNPFAYRFTPPYNYTTTWTADEGEGPVEIASGTNIFTQSVSPTVTTTYTISYTNQTTGCTNALDSAQVVMTVLSDTPPIGVATLSSQSILCPGTTTTNLSLGNLASPDGLTFQWQQNTGAGYSNIVGAPSAPTYTATPGAGTTLYRCRISSCSGTPGSSSAVSVLVPVVTPLTLSASTASYCAGGSASVTVTSGASYYSSFTWSPATVTGDANTGFTFTAPGTYILTAAAPVNGCGATAQVVVTVNAVAGTPTVTPASPTYGCGNPGTLLSVGATYTNPTPSGSCLSNINGVFPAAAYTPATCDGSTVNSITTLGYASEHSLVNVNSNSLYTFASSIAGDIVEITATDGTTVLAYGPSPVTWFNNIGATQVRFYTQVATCVSNTSFRVRSVVCLSSPTAVFSPATGLFNDAAGLSPYNGTTAVTQVYARPTATQLYSVVSNNGFNCPSPATNVTVTTTPCNSIVNLKLFIEGYYDATIGAMRSVKNNQDGVSPITDVEDITVELRSAPTVVDATTTAVLKTDGTAVCTFSTPLSGLFYIVVKSSTALQTWSSNLETVGSTPVTYDFSTAANKAFGDNMIQVDTVFAFYSGDINQDDVIDGADAPELDSDIFNSETGVRPTDLNGDGSVDGSDSVFYENNSFNSIFAQYP